MKEKPIDWRPVFGYVGKYEVSNSGEVRTIDGQVVGQWANDQGYMLVRLSRPRKMHRVHRLVASAFLPNPHGLECINHIDFARDNNCVENLEWCTQKENIAHSQNSGRMCRDYWKGKRSPSAMLSDSIVEKIRSEYADGGTSWEKLGKKYGVSKRAIGRLLTGETYERMA